MSSRVLLVDDDSNILLGLQRTFRKQFLIDTAQGGAEALELIERNGPYAVIVADMSMPGMNGAELLKRVHATAPDTVRIMLTGNADQRTAVEAVNQGHIFQFLSKPCPPQTIGSALENGLRQHRLITAEKELLEKTLQGAIKVLTDTLSISDPESFGHGQVLRDYVKVFTRTYKHPNSWEMELAAMLAHIGFVTVPQAVCQKARAHHSLTGEERDMLTRVPQIGAGLIEAIPRLENVAKIILYQNKNFDGSGFPSDAVRGEEIPIGARILKVLSDLLQLEAKNMPKFKALEVMKQRAGAYDPNVLTAAFASFDIYLPAATETPEQIRLLRCDELRVGQTLLSNVETRDGMLIVAAGTRLSAALIERLKNWDRLNGVKEPIQVSDTIITVEQLDSLPA